VTHEPAAIAKQDVEQKHAMTATVTSSAEPISNGAFTIGFQPASVDACP
jgi:hypothetical protein